MTQWYVKELSELTHTSVQTLHHYDRIGLLEPSVRLANGYRLYSEKDLLKLQQIIALKFFGFELSKIKTFLSSDVDMIDHFTTQSQFLEEKAKTLFEASQTLKNIIDNCSHNKSIPWENIIKLIEVYRMTQQLERTWAAKIFTSEELKKFVQFEQGLKKRFTEKEQKALGDEWINLVRDVNANLNKDPSSEFGIAMGKRCMDWVNTYYGKENVALRNKIWEEGLKKGQIDHQDALSPPSFEWLEKAISAYYRGRIMAILSQVGVQPQTTLLTLWETLMTDMHGDEKAPRDEMLEAILNNEVIPKAQREWVKEYIRSQK